MNSDNKNSKIKKFLSKTDLIEFTGKIRSDAQARYLQNNHIPFILNANNHPKVLWNTLFQILGYANNQAHNFTQPNLSALDVLDGM